MKGYGTVSEAVNDLIKRGFTHDFKICADGVECPLMNIRLSPEHFEIVEVHRFEGESDPADEAVVYAIQSDTGVKGILVNGYGIYSDSISDAMVKKLKEHLL
jgi:hypothetical protein